jgi:hypothetical protein
MIRELAEFEGQLDLITIREEDLAHDGFGETNAGFADHSSWKPDGIGMCLRAPGLTLVLKNAVPFGHPSNWLDALARAGTTAFSVTWAYYTALSNGVLAIGSALRRKP